jgi:hypothetical protein
MSEQFHAHLDGCRQCREEIFNLCPVGVKLLEEAALDLEDSMLTGLSQWNKVLRNAQP